MFLLREGVVITQYFDDTLFFVYHAYVDEYISIGRMISTIYQGSVKTRDE